MKTTSLLFTTLLVFIIFFSACKKPEPSEPCFTFERPDSLLRELQFSNCSKNAISYAWDFGDGQTSIEENPTHVYAEEGNYTITLKTKNEEGEEEETSDLAKVPNPNKFFTISSDRFGSYVNEGDKMEIDLLGYIPAGVKRVKLEFLFSENWNEVLIDTVFADHTDPILKFTAEITVPKLRDDEFDVVAELIDLDQKKIQAPVQKLRREPDNVLTKHVGSEFYIHRIGTGQPSSFNVITEKRTTGLEVTHFMDKTIPSFSSFGKVGPPSGQGGAAFLPDEPDRKELKTSEMETFFKTGNFYNVITLPDDPVGSFIMIKTDDEEVPYAVLEIISVINESDKADSKLFFNIYKP